MATHYPHARTKENNQGLHYSPFSGLTHRTPPDSQAIYFSARSISRPNPLSWVRLLGGLGSPLLFEQQKTRHLAGVWLVAGNSAVSD
jgi:hypothetical protein